MTGDGFREINVTFDRELGRTICREHGDVVSHTPRAGGQCYLCDGVRTCQHGTPPTVQGYAHSRGYRWINHCSSCKAERERQQEQEQEQEQERATSLPGGEAPATARQLNYLAILGVVIPPNRQLGIRETSAIIDSVKSGNGVGTFGLSFQDGSN